ncbi:hypothetical protein BJX64DRAFT_281902 [Aspergillus heterothallicus]
MLRLSDNDLNPDPDSIFSLLESQLEVDSPLERWRNSPPDVEPAHRDAIMRAVASSDLQNGSDEAQSSNPQDIARSQASSIAPESARSSYSDSGSASSAYSFASNRSAGSFGRFYLTEPARRRRRRRPSSPRLLSENQKQRRYQCTFCTDAFHKKHDWTRHEKTLHLSLEKFTCSPSGPAYTDASATERCAFCDEPTPSEAHISSHRASICAQNPLTLRTFYRKDHLLQHLRTVHKTTQFTPVMETWKSQETEVRSRCGFCAETFTRWAERNNHLAKHFRGGAQMCDWKGCRGFEPAVALAVENAMPPYLIGQEARELCPFSATNGRGSNLGRVEAFAEPERPTSFEVLTGHLASFVDRAQAEGEVVTDEILQAESRYIVFGDGDPWNQTAADNPEWLRLFREGMDRSDARGDWKWYIVAMAEP